MRKIVIIIFLIIFSPVFFAYSETSDSIIEKIINSENNSNDREGIRRISDTIDDIYVDLYSKLLDGKKIVIYVDPAHGRLPSGNWQGAVTWRQSTTGQPEEFYSIKLIRPLYKRLASNKFIEVISTDDYMEVMKGSSDEYKKNWFPETIKRAKEANAFIIIASHLNNVSPIYKAEGLSNIRGIHVTCDEYGNKYLTNITNISRGFLTLYNKFDATGVSKAYAENIRSELVAYNFTPNGWQNGAVADDRFTYFSDYPMSVIYESGFISNPDDEKIIMDKKNQDLIAKSQYDALLRTINENFGVDISGSKPWKTKETPEDLIDIMKISRFIIYYIKQQDVVRAIQLCDILEKRYSGSEYSDSIATYSTLKRRLIAYNSNIMQAKKLHQKKKLAKAAVFYRNAIHSLGYNPVFSNLNRSAYMVYQGLPFSRTTSNDKEPTILGSPPEFGPIPYGKEYHSLKTPFILAIKDGDSLEEAIDRAIDPQNSIKEKVYSSFKNSTVTQNSWDKVYNKKKKKYTWKKSYKKIHVNFSQGIYVVTLDKKFNLSSVKKVSRVAFNPKKFQNQEYFKNSCLAAISKNKSL